ncbi:isopentenyl phosphate kinase [Candidatus Mancarchaeum acidiphilum]|nr:isopentenyl phosphate kinase [Candidatus Mancarchaeum acidiphilum]
MDYKGIIMEPLVFLKLGGGTITYDSRESTPRIDVIDRLLSEIKKAKEEHGFDLILGHGSGSYAHVPASKYKVNEGLKYEFSRMGATVTCNTAKALNTVIIEEAIKIGLDTYPFSPSSFAYAGNGRIIKGVTDGIRKSLESGFTPVVYGDVLIDDVKGVTIASTEEVFNFLSTEFGPDKIIIGADVDGVFDSNPTQNANAKKIDRVDNSNIDTILKGASGSNKSFDVTGGMHTKVEMLYNMVKGVNEKFGKPSIGYIGNAAKEGVIGKLLSGKPVNECTEFSYR